MSFLESLEKRVAVVRKGHSFALRIPKHVMARRASPALIAKNPVYLANSFPKSGTHLLLQILSAFPNAHQYKMMLASTPSLTLRQRSDENVIGHVRNFVPGEVLGAHLFHNAKFISSMDRRNVAHYFIYRDLRDVVVSEMHYLKSMNHWHRLHKFMLSLSSDNDRISALLTGIESSEFGVNYPGIDVRWRLYSGWMRENSVYSIKFENLMDPTKKEALIREMVHFAEQRSSADWRVEKVVGDALKAINPSRSHTFRSGETGAWQRVFTCEHKEIMKESTGDILIELGYETDQSW